MGLNRRKRASTVCNAGAGGRAGLSMQWRRYHHQSPPPSFLNYNSSRIPRGVSPCVVKMAIILMFALLQHPDTTAVLSLAADARLCLDNANIFQCLIYFVLVETTTGHNRLCEQTSWTTVNLSWDNTYFYYLVFLNFKLYIFRISKVLFDENSKVLN